MSNAVRSESIGRTALWVLISSGAYYAATLIAWALCFPDSKVSLFFPPHAVLVSVLLLVPTRHWWAYTLAAAGAHFLATQQAHWPFWYAVNCEVFDAAQNVLAAGGIRMLLKSPLRFVIRREAAVFVLIAVFLVPFGTAFWGAAFTISYGFGTYYWIEWRNLAISNAVTAIVLVPAILAGRDLSLSRLRASPRRLLEAGLLGAGLLIVGFLAFDHVPAGPDRSPALLYIPVLFLIWAALRFGVGGTSAFLVVITIQAIWGTMHGRGPFLLQTAAENAFSLQSFLLVISIPLLLLAVMVEEDDRSRRALRDSEERYREVVESQTDLVCRHQADSTLTFVNDASCRFFRRRSEELLGLKLLDLIPPRAREVVSAHTATVNREHVSITDEIEVLLPDKSTGWYQWTTYLVAGHADTDVEFQAIGHDISDRKRAEDARRHMAHAARVSTLGALAGSLAHELNQPLTTILSNAQAGSRLLAEPTPNVAETREILQDIADNAQRTGRLIYQMRAMVRREAPNLAPLDLNRVLLDVARLLHSDMLIRKTQIAFELDAQLPLARGDEVQVQQVLLNLVQNACDSMRDVAEDQRTVVLRTRHMDAAMIRIEVSDSGTGLSPDRLARLVEPFRTSKREGLGMGLSISQSIVEAHMGRLWAANNPDRGATFYFTLPIDAAASPRRLSADAAEFEDTTGMTKTRSNAIVFVVDDEESVRKAIARMLRAFGFAVETFGSAQEFLSAGHYRDTGGCVVADLRMPGLGGLELQRELKIIAPALPVILLTGHGDSVTGARVMKSGAADWLTKPVQAEDLLRVIQRAIARSSQSSEHDRDVDWGTLDAGNQRRV